MVPLREDGSVILPCEYASVIAMTSERVVHDTVMQIVTLRRQA
jgi:hypothetical protein